MSEQQQQQLIDLIDDHALEKFVVLYGEISSNLKSFEHVELLLRACRFGTLSFVQSILNNNSVIDVNCRHPSTGFSPLFIAIRAQQHDIIEYFIRETQADVNCNFQTNTTCLHEALRQRDLFTIKLLLEHDVIIDESHLFLVIIECFRGEINKGTSPLILFDTLISHRPELLEGEGRTRVTKFILRRVSWPSMNQSKYIVPLLQRLSLDESSNHLINDTSIEEGKSISSHIHRTQVAIIGAGPAGLMLGALLSRSGIDSIIFERHSQSYVESNIRAGVIEQSTVDLLDHIDTAENIFRKGYIQRSILLQFDGERMCLPLTDMTQGKMETVYGQHYLLQDLIKKRLSTKQRLWFDIGNIQIEQSDTTGEYSNPIVRFRRRNQTEWEEVYCDFIGGCDGAVSECCRQSIPRNIIQTIEQTYPFAWLSILVEAPPSGTQIIYSNHSKYGFALHSFRSKSQSRYHLQVSCHDRLDDWPDERIWKELDLRLTPTNESSWSINKGSIIQRAIFTLRNTVHSPMQYKRLFLVGDAAHIFPPTGAKGLNVAVNDAKILSQAFVDYYETDSMEKLDKYTETCLPHVWQIQKFTTYMTSLFHNFNLTEEDEENNEKFQLDQQMQKVQRKMFQQSYDLQCHVAQMIAH